MTEYNHWLLSCYTYRNKSNIGFSIYTFECDEKKLINMDRLVLVGKSRQEKVWGKCTIGEQRFGLLVLRKKAN